jgi:hypothetical protein
MLWRVLAFLAALTAAQPAFAQAGSELLLFGVGSLGGGGAYGPLTPPALTPQLAASFDSNIANGYSNNGAKVNGGGAVGSMEYPTTATNSVFFTFEESVDASLPTFSAPEYFFGTASGFTGPTINGPPTIIA